MPESAPSSQTEVRELFRMAHHPLAKIQQKLSNGLLQRDEGNINS
jgi:hypothetical protein